MDVSVVIITYNTLKMTYECIKSIQEHTHGIEYEILLVDNASMDGSKEFFNKIKGITYIYSNLNLGFGKANNLGFKQAKGKYVFCLNSDTLFLNNALKIFFDYAESHEEKAMYGCDLLDQNKEVIYWTNNKFPTIGKILYENLKYKLHLPFHFERLPAPPYEVEYIVGAAMFIPKLYIDMYGGFDEHFFMYFEESDLQKRYDTAGVKRIMIPGPLIIHLEGKTSGKSPICKRYSMESSMIYFKKHSTSIAYGYYRFAYFTLNLLFLPFTRDSIKGKIKTLKILTKCINL